MNYVRMCVFDSETERDRESTWIEKLGKKQNMLTKKWNKKLSPKIFTIIVVIVVVVILVVK